jgi:hypothetical protein
LINIRPAQGNRSMIVEDEGVREIPLLAATAS